MPLHIGSQNEGATTESVLFVGQVGLNKTPFIEKIGDHLGSVSKHDSHQYNVGQMMYAEDPEIPAGGILRLARGHLKALRRSVFRDILRCDDTGYQLVNTHAAFRWHQGLLEALDHDLLTELAPTRFMSVVANFHEVYHGLRNHDVDLTLRDVLVWREEELAIGRVYASCLPHRPESLIVSRGVNDRRAEAVARLIHNPYQLRVYPSFPMTHVMKLKDVWAEICAFRDEIAEEFYCSDPADVDEKGIMFDAAEAKKRRRRTVGVNIDGETVTFNVRELLALEPLVDAQICDRDFRLIDQSDVIVSLVPELAGGTPGLSSGVERELQHASKTGKQVYVVWKPKGAPSPFVTNHAQGVFKTTEEALRVLRRLNEKKAAQYGLPKPKRRRSSTSRRHTTTQKATRRPSRRKAA